MVMSESPITHKWEICFHCLVHQKQKVLFVCSTFASYGNLSVTTDRLIWFLLAPSCRIRTIRRIVTRVCVSVPALRRSRTSEFWIYGQEPPHIRRVKPSVHIVQ